MKNKKYNESFLKLISISCGFAMSFLLLELFARIAPANSTFPLEKPIECDNFERITLSCLHRRKAFSKGIWTVGKFRPLNQVILKKTNDIGQFSDINFNTFIANKNNNVQVLSIGDSFVQALQVTNPYTFHGILNKKKTKNNQEIISTAIGASGMAFPNYIMSIKYAETQTDLKDIILVIPIIANDFDESFKQYALKGRRAGLGQFYFNETSDKMDFIKFPKEKNITQKSIDFILKNSALSRFIIYNLEIGNLIRNNLSFLTNANKPKTKVKFAANIIESSKKETPERFTLGNIAVYKFIKNLKELRKTSYERNRTFLVIDSDRNAIYNNFSIDESSFYQTMRRRMIHEAKKNGFKVINMENIFREDYSLSKKRFNSKYDGHWNAYGHAKVSNEILYEIKKLSRD